MMLVRFLLVFFFTSALMAQDQPATASSVVDEAWQAIADNYVEMATRRAEWDRLRKDYVARTYKSPDEAHSAIREMLEHLHNSRLQWLSAEDAAAVLPEFGAEQSPKLGLAFLSFEFLPGHKRIIAPLAGSPAARAGIRSGDELLSVDGQDVGAISPGGLLRLLAQAGKSTNFRIERAGKKLSLAVEAQPDFRHFAEVTSSSGSGKRLERRITVREFTAYTAEQFRIALGEGTGPVTIDLTNNPGGLLDSAVEILSMFISNGEVLCRKDMTGKTECVKTQAGPVNTARLTVLVNEGTASAAEIFAAAIQRTGRGKVVGCRTYGHGYGGRFIQLSDGSALLVPDSIYLNAHGEPIEGKGIIPDISDCQSNLQP